MTKLRQLIIAILLLMFALSCNKQQDLVEKAFEGKNFDQKLPPVEQKAPESEEDEGDEDTQIEVLVDNLTEDVPVESVFTETGETTRPDGAAFSTDPDVQGLKFDEIALYEVVQALLNLLEVNYIIDPVLKDQAITLDIKASDRPFKASELLDLLLKLHDLTMIVHETYVHVVPIDNPEVIPGLRLLYGSRGNESMRREELAIQVVPLKYVSPADVTGVIKEFLSPSARVYEELRSNVLIIIDKYQYIAKAMELMPIFDVDVLANKKMVFYQLAHVDAVETASRLQEILAVYGYEPDGERLGIVTIDTLNGLLVVSSVPTIFQEVNFWIDKFDQEAQFEEEQVFIYQVENTTVDSIAFTLSQLYGFQTSGSFGAPNAAASNRRTTNPNLNPNDPNSRNNLNNNQNNRNNNRNNRNGLNNQQQAGGALNNPRNNFNQQRQIQGSTDPNAPKMVVDEDNNSLIFMTTPREYSRVLRTLRKLDVLPRQVFLEVTVLSVELRDNFAFGLNWNAVDDESVDVTNSQDSFGVGFPLNATGLDGNAISVSPFGGFYNYVGSTGIITATINALKTKGYANLLQQPHIMAVDNKPATISVGTEIPIATATTNINNISTGSAVNPATSSTIQYRSTGVNLTFTPHINANGVIRLELALDISAPGAEQASEGQAVPISTNSLQTEMIVRDSQTAIMGGLIFDEESWSKDTVPFLGRIPLLRHLFTDRSSRSTRQELVVMITPRLIDSEEKAIQISKEFKDKIMREFETFKANQK